MKLLGSRHHIEDESDIGGLERQLNIISIIIKHGPDGHHACIACDPKQLNGLPFIGPPTTFLRLPDRALYGHRRADCSPHSGLAFLRHVNKPVPLWRIPRPLALLPGLARRQLPPAPHGQRRVGAARGCIGGHAGRVGSGRLGASVPNFYRASSELSVVCVAPSRSRLEKTAERKSYKRQVQKHCTPTTQTDTSR